MNIYSDNIGRCLKITVVLPACTTERSPACGVSGDRLGWRAAASSSVSVETPRPRSLCLRGAPPVARTLPSAPHRAARPHCCAPVLIRVSHVHYAYVCLSACALSSVLTVRRGVLPLKNEHPEETSRPGERAKPA